jgi:hypothetical protein
VAVATVAAAARGHRRRRARDSHTVTVGPVARGPGARLGGPGASGPGIPDHWQVLCIDAGY